MSWSVWFRKQITCCSCLCRWLKDKNSCPICRRDVDSADNAGQATSNRNRRDQAQRTSGTWEPEMLFRLNQMNELYPDFVTQNMISTWYRQHRNHRPFDFRNHSDFRSWDPTTIALRNEGQYGALHSFGGGSSEGGGGASSSW